MLLLHDWSLFPQNLRGGVLCVGNFDGVHLGHAKMLATGREQATARSIPFTIATFDPHPASVLKPNTLRRPLTTTTQRQQLLSAFNPDVLLLLKPTPEFLSITPESFLRDIVLGHNSPPRGIGGKVMVEGPTFTFGRGAKGNPDLLRALGPSLGIEAIIVEAQDATLSDMTLARVSSSLIRWLIEQGRVADAARALGRPYSLVGTVVEGQKRGRAIGFPTANLDSAQHLPAAGIYAGHARVHDRTYQAAISIGDNPTFNSAPAAPTVEAFLLDFDGDLYGQTLELQFDRWIRDMYAFGGVEPLVAQMKRDVEQVRTLVHRFS